MTVGTHDKHYHVRAKEEIPHVLRVCSLDDQRVAFPMSLITHQRYVVPPGRVVVPTGRYIVPAGKVIIIVSTGRLSLVPTGRILSLGLKDLSRTGPTLTHLKESQQIQDNEVHQSAINIIRRPSREVHATNDHVNLHKTLFQKGPTRFHDERQVLRLTSQVIPIQENRSQGSSEGPKMPPKRTSTSEALAMTHAATRKLVADSVATALEAQATMITSTNNPNRNSGLRKTPVARKCTYEKFMSFQPFYFNGTEGTIGLIRWFKLGV
ncbi:hypothetical protein Tco_0668261 [Tanacetum coccineum]